MESLGNFQKNDQVQELPSYVSEVPLENSLSDNGVYVFEKKYLSRDRDGKVIETPSKRAFTIAKCLAEIERRFGKSEEEIREFTKQFYLMIAEGRFSPAGRIWSNVGTGIKGLFNCYVLPVEDDLGEIYESVKKAALIHKNGGGTGYNFSKLRPRGTYVQQARGIASGPVSFIKQFDRETEVINSGNRRGANMGILNIDHPDILDFIYAKTKRGEITNFNVSVGITDEFMMSVENQEYYHLRHYNGKLFTVEELKNIVRNIEENKLGGAEVGKLPQPASLNFECKPSEVVLGKTKVVDSFSGKEAGIVDEQGHIKLSSIYIFDILSELAWKTADPGIIFLDEINRFNPLPGLGRIDATNPCGEQPLHPHDACNLGSVNLSEMLTEKEGQMFVDFNKIERTVKTAIRFMDNVNDLNIGPIKQVEETVLNHRRIGLGVMGWADMLAKIGYSYDSEEGRELGEQVMKFITEVAKKTSVELANEKGVFPFFEKSIYANMGEEERVRNVQRTTIAPTGTISMIYDVASGIEPYFALTFRKNIRGGDSLIFTNKVFLDACKKRGINIDKFAPLIEKNHGSVQGIEGIPKDLQEVFKTAHDINTSAHIRMQAAFQKVTDNAVSKTINLPNDATIEDVKDAYFQAWKERLKGITVYRDGCKSIQVLEAGEKKKETKVDDVKEIVLNELKRSRPESIIGRTEKVPTPFGHNVFVTLNWEVDGEGNKRPYECFAYIGKASGDLPGLAESIGRLTSLSLKAGVPIESIIQQLEGIGGENQTGFGKDKIRSLPDAIARGIKLAVMKEQPNMKEIKTEKKKMASGNVCPSCLTALVREEGCEKCYSCGFSKC